MVVCKLEFRKATIFDCEQITELRMEMRQERDKMGDIKELRENTLQFFQKNLREGSFVSFLCIDNERIVGTVGLTLFEMPPTSQLTNGKVAKLMNMYTTPEYRRQGIGTQMLNLAIEFLREHSYFKVMLNSSPMGREMYQKFGFSLIPNEYEYYISLVKSN